MRRVIVLICAILAFLLGGLWLLQGMGIVHLKPILCFADCAELQGPSVTWAIIGAVMMAVGAAGVVWSRRRSPK